MFNKNILAVVAHPDDEALGAGAAISKWSEQGHNITVLTLGIKSPTREKDLFTPQRKSHKLLGISKTINLDIDAMTISGESRYEITKKIENAIISTKPDVLITHNPSDIHNDHRVLSQITQEAARLPIRQTGYYKPFELWYMEILSSTDWGFGDSFSPNVYVEVTKEQIEKKIKSIEVYKEVLRPVPHPRNEETIKAEARLRGSACGSEFAEAFFCAYRKASIPG